LGGIINRHHPIFLPRWSNKPVKNILKPFTGLCPNLLKGLLKKAANCVLFVRRAQRTLAYASPSSLLAALLDGLFEQSLSLLLFLGVNRDQSANESIFNFSTGL
jgi:hypothetical protein